MTTTSRESRLLAKLCAPDKSEVPAPKTKTPFWKAISPVLKSVRGMLKLIKTMVCAVAVITLWTIVLLTPTAYALDVKPIDSCVGVDHPPFERAYPGDGKSYLNLGLTLPLQHFEGGAVVGVLVGNDRTVEAADKVDANGRVFLSFPLYSYGSYEVTVTGEGGHPIFKENVSVGPEEHPCDRELLAKSPPRVQDSGSEGKAEAGVKADPTPVAEPATEQESEVATVTSITDSAKDRSWWPLLAIGLGLGLGVVGLILMQKGPCEKERRAWEEAERRAKEARDAAERAREMVEQTAEKRAELAAELAEIGRTYPSAGKSGGDEAWAESDGRRITSRDLALRREAEQAAWREYRQNPTQETAEELEKAWNEAAEPHTEAERREIDEHARELEQNLDKAKEAERDARRAADEAEQAAEQAASEADTARRVYEKCIGKGTSPGGCTSCGGDNDGAGGAATTDQGPGTQTRERRCREDEPPQERNRREMGVVSFPVRLEVELRGGHAHEAAKEAREISDQLADAAEKLGWISKLMDLKGIGSALVRDGFGWSALEASGAPLAGAVTGTPVPTSPGQAAVDYLSTVANIASVIVRKVPELQARRLPDCELSVSIIRRTLRATCTEIWVCRDGRWVKDRTKFTLTVVGEGRAGTRRYDALTWDQAQATIASFEAIQMNQLQNALDQIARLESGCGQ